MKYSINTLLWSDNGLDEKTLPVFDLLKKMGYDGVELPIFTPRPLDQCAEVGRSLDSLGLERTSVTICGADYNPISPDLNCRRKAQEHLYAILDCCKALGMETLVGPNYAALGLFTGKGPTTDEWKWGVETLRPVAEYARQLGIKISLEYLNRFEIYFLNCAGDAHRFVSEINVPGCGTLYDTFHANIEEKNVSEAIRTCANSLNHVHISENDRSTPGSGGVRWEETFKVLKEIKYDGWYTIEAFGTALPAVSAATKIWRKMYRDEEQLARDGLAFMKKMTA